MMHVQVYHEKQQEYYLVPIDKSDSFQLLKEKLYNKLEGLVEDEEISFSIFTMEMASPFAKQIKRRNHTPFDSDIVFEVVQRVEKIYSGYITLKLVDIRGDGDHWSGESISSSELLQMSTADKHERFGDSESCTVWASSGYNSIGGGVMGVEHGNSGSLSPGANGASDAQQSVPRLFCSPTLLDSLFTELSAMAVIQGRLSKKISSHRKQDIWRDQYFILDGRMGRLWFFPIAADLSASGGNNIASNVNHNRELGASGLGVPSFISLLCGTNTRAQDAVTVSSHRSDQTAFTITISETYSVAAGAVTAPLSAFNSRSVTLRAPTAEKAARWVQRLSSLHGMLNQPLLPPGPDNPRLYDQVASKFVQEYAQGKLTYTAAALTTLSAHEPHSAHSRNHAPPTLSECGGGGGEGAPPVPATARCSSHWASNSMMESVEECVSATQQGNTARDGDHLEALMTFEGMLKSKYLRGYFQKYLMNNCTEETLLFWEYAEDYWRAHPYSPHPFAPSHTSSSSTSSSPSSGGMGASVRINAANDVLHVLREQDAAVLTSPAAVRQWAESLYLTFIHYNAPYQIGCCTGKDMLRVGAALDQLAEGDMPPYNLFRAIQLSTFNFMKTMCYPDFTAQHNYHRILVAALHAGDRAAMNVHVLATHIASEREPSTFDGFHHSNPSPNIPAAPAPAAGASPAATSRGFLGLMRNIVGGKAKDAHSAGITTAHESAGGRGAGGLGVDVQSYPARWRIVKLVAFELVRGDAGILTTTGGTAASADSVATGSAKYKIGRRKDSRRSIVGDKLKKIRALQNGVYKKISWLPEWWWDLVPTINPLEEAPGQSVWDISTLSDVGDLLEEDGSSVGVWTGTSAGEEESFLDETSGSEQLSDPPATAAAPLNTWTYDAECGTNWMPTDSNYIKGVFERTRRALEAEREAHSDSASLHVRLLLQKQRAEEDDQGADPHARRSSVPNLFLPPGWKPNAVNNPINGAKVAQLLEAPQVSPSMMSYSSSMPACISELNLSMGRALLEDYAHLQPGGYHMQVAQAGTGALVMCSVVRCRYLRPSLKQQPVNMLMRGFRNSVAVGASLHPQQATDRRSVESSDGHGHYTPPRTNSGPNPRRTVLGSSNGLHRSESVCISSAPLPVLSAQQVAYTKTALAHQPTRRSDEFTATATNTNTIAEWPRQCAALYLCLGVPRLYLIDPSSLVPSALIDLHSVRRIAPSEQCLHSIDIQDQTSCVWQVSPEGIDADDTREGSRRWINTLAALCLPSTSIVHIIKSGYLQKRGRVNKAFKLRWFVLCSDLRLHYYKDDQHGVLKGTIELTSDFGSAKHERHSAGEKQKQVVRFDKELVVTMQATKRMYTLMAEDALQAEDWMNILNDLLSSPVQPGAGTHGPVSPLRSHHAGELDEEEEEDDDEE